MDRDRDYDRSARRDRREREDRDRTDRGRPARAGWFDARGRYDDRSGYDRDERSGYARDARDPGRGRGNWQMDHDEYVDRYMDGDRPADRGRYRDRDGGRYGYGGAPAGGLHADGGYGSNDREDRGDRWGASEWEEQAARAEGPHVGRGPEGYKRSEDRILEDANEALTWHGHVDARRIRVTVDGDEVTLEGTVDDRRAKRAAEDAVEGVRGVRDVHNRLRLEAARDASDS